MQHTKSRKVKKTQHDLYHDLLNIKSALSNTADGVKGRAEDMVSDLLEDLQNRTSGLQDEVETYVAEKPLQTLGIAVLFGIFIGKIIL
jgi:ElaB/YqjD/DUF883 family membrane-anchored ribosome-binding protein